MNLNGQKQQKGKSTKERTRELQVMVENLQMASQVNQMMLKQVLQQFQNLRADLDNTMGILNDFQYRTQAMMKLGNFDLDVLNEEATQLKLNDYMKASDAEDAQKGYEVDNGDINEESIIILTSTTNGDKDRGIFRSKFHYSECQTETLKEKLLGKKVGDKFEEEINGDVHEIEIVGLRKASKLEETPQEGPKEE